MPDLLHEALPRTALLLRLDAFPCLDAARDGEIVDALRGVGVRIVADRANVASPNGQTTLVTLVCQCAMLGVRVDLDVPDVPQLIPQPPLRADLRLGSALRAWTDGMFPGCLTTVAKPIITLAIGSSRTRGAVHVGGAEHTVTLDSDPLAVPVWSGETPFGAIASAATAAAEVMRAAIPTVATALGMPLPTDITWKPRPFTPVHLELPTMPIVVGNLGAVDLVSAGAITHAVLYTLLRVPGISADLRPLDRDRLGASNSNRYALARTEDFGRAKVDQLADFSTDKLPINGEVLRLNADTLEAVGGLAPKVLVGVDDIPTRWFLQRQQPAWMAVGATSHAFVVVSDHVPGHPCAGCVHPLDEGDPLEDIPTIGYVSLWAGLLLAGTLLEPDAMTRLGTRRVEAHPMGLYGPHALKAFPTSANPRCPVCAAHPGAA